MNRDFMTHTPEVYDAAYLSSDGFSILGPLEWVPNGRAPSVSCPTAVDMIGYLCGVLLGKS